MLGIVGLVEFVGSAGEPSTEDRLNLHRDYSRSFSIAFGIGK